jgi:hypothetical protein
MSKRPRRDRAATSPPSMSCSEEYNPGASTPRNTGAGLCGPVADEEWPLRSAELTATKDTHCVLLGYDTVQPGNPLPVATSSSIPNATPLLKPTHTRRTNEHCLGKLSAGHFCTWFQRKNVVRRMDDARFSKARRQEHLLAILYLRRLRLFLLIPLQRSGHKNRKKKSLLIFRTNI